MSNEKKKKTQPGAMDDNATKRAKENKQKKMKMLEDLDAKFSNGARRKNKKRIIYG